MIPLQLSWSVRPLHGSRYISLRLSLNDRIAHGAFADIFAPPPGDRALKLFRRLAHPAFSREAPIMFADECAAYQLAMREEAVRPFVPTFYGPVAVTSVTNTAGLDISSGYWLSLCYSMERLEACERHEHERADGDRPGARHEAGRQRVARLDRRAP